MLQLTIPKSELFDDEKQEFVEAESTVVMLEHSLVSISKWESKWNKPFLGKDEKTVEQYVDYIRCMTLNNVKPTIYEYLANDIFSQISDYINSPMTATWFNELPNQPKTRETVTSELIYYWMITLNIPMECQKWHLNRLLTLIKVCNIKNSPPKKMGRKEMLSRRQSLNKARRSQLNTKG